MATYVNNLRLTEITTGDESGTWGTTTNSNWDFATDAFGYGVKNMAGDANETFTMADGSVDTLRSMYLKITSTVAPLTATRTLTIAPNTVSKVWIIENNAAGSQSISIKQGSGAEITIATGTRAMVYTDGAGAGAAVFLASPTISTLAGTVPVANGGTSLTTLTANNVILGNGASAPTFVAPSTSGNVLTSNGTTWSSTAPATSGTVTSVAATVPTLLSVSGSPITSSGTLAFTYSGTALPVANGGTALTTGTSGGVLAYTASGTLASSAALTQYGVVYGGGAGAVPVATAAGTNGQVLTATTAGAPSWASPATSGTVTSVAATVPSIFSISGSPITSSGTLAMTYSGTALPVANGGTGQTSNFTQYGVVYAPTTTTLGNTGAGTTTTVLHGNVSGAPTYAAVSLTADVSDTLPVANGGTGAATLTANYALLGNGTSAPQMIAPSTSGNVLTSNGTTWSSTAPATGGTVTSVAASVPSIFSISGSPITTSGTLAMTYSGTALPVANGGTGQSSNFTQYGVVYAPTTTTLGNTGAGTTTTVLHGNVSGAPTYAAVSLTADVSGTLPVANGGTSLTTLTANNVILGNGASAPTFVAPSSSGNVLTSNGTTWSSTAPAGGVPDFLLMAQGVI